MAKKIKLVLALDGEKEFTSAVTQINKQLGLTDAQLKKTSAEFEGQANSVEALRAKQELLSKKLQQTKEKLEAQKAGAENARQAYAKVAENLNTLHKAYSNAKKALEDMKKAGNSSEDEMRQQENAVKELGDAIAQQEGYVQRAENRITSWDKKIAASETELIRANSALNKNAAYLKEAEEATDDCATSIDKFGNAAKNTIDITSGWGEKIQSALVDKTVSAGFDLLKDAAAAAGEAITETATDVSSASSQLAASTGLSEAAAEKYQTVMKEIRGANYGESYQDVADVMAETIQIMGELNDTDMTGVVEGAITLRDTFDMDVNETLRAVDVMMQTMGLDAAEAFDLIAKGAQNGLNRSGELTDNITEYGQLWAQAGFSAEEMFAIMENGLDAGAYNLDKVNDYVKEFGNSLADGRVEDHLGSFSAESKELFEQWKNGEASTKDVFYSIIDDLSKMENQQEALTIASDVWSALGEDNSLKVLTALDDVNEGYTNVKGTMESMQEVKYDNLESALSGLGAAVQDKFIEPVASGLADVLTPALEAATEAINGMGDDVDPQLSSITELIDGAKSANDELERSLDNGSQALEDAELDGTKLETLGQQLLTLNAVEEKSAAQKYQLKAIVEELGASIPEIADAYSEETAQVNLSDEAVQSLISSTKELMVAQAAQSAAQETANALVKAQVEYEKAAEASAAASDKAAMYEEERELLQNLTSEYNAYTEARAYTLDPQILENIESTMTNAEKAEGEYIAFWNEQLENGRATLEEYNEAMEYASADWLVNRLAKQEGALNDWTSAAKDASETTEDLAENVTAGEEDLDRYAKAAAELADSTSGVEDAGNDAAQGIANLKEETESAVAPMEDLEQSFTDMWTGAASAEERFQTSTAGITQSAQELAQDVEASSETQKSAMDGLLETYTSTMESIEADIQNKINPFDKFDGGDDVTAEDMLANLQSQTEGLENYKENLQTITDAMGDEIAPEFLQYIESMGTDGANMLQHMVDTLGQGNGAELIRQMSEEYVKALDLSEDIARTGAANETAYQMAMGELGSSDEDFSSLQDSISAAIEGAATNAESAWGTLDAATEQALQDVISTAQACGAQIPEGLAEGIASGEISPENAISQLKGSIQGTFDGLVEIAKENGINIPSELAAGLEGGTGETVAAIQQICSLISSELNSLENGEQEAAGAQAAEGLANGVAENAENVSAAAQNVVDSAAAAATAKAADFQESGRTAAANFAAGIAQGQSAAITQAAAMALAAILSAKNNTGGASSIGLAIASGVAAGISAGSGSAITAAANLAAQALSAAKSRLGIHSPSTVFRKEVGQQISSGMAFGIADKASLAGKQAKRMSSKVYQNAVSWLSKYKKSQSVSLSDEKWYWQQVVKHTKAGTTAYNNALKKLNSITVSELTATGLSSTTASKITSNFGVSRKTTTGSGKNKKTTKKDAETYYSEIYSAAEKYASNQQILNSWSLEQQLAYWTAVKGQLKSGTQAWYDATKEINSIQEDIEQAQQDAITERANVQSKLLSSYKTYYKMSAKAEMEYWNLARQQFAAGTDERIEADQNYLEALQDFYDERKELDEDYAENSAEINEQLQEDIKDLQDTYKEAVQSRKEDILSSMDLFEAYDSTGYDAETLIYNLKTQVAGLTLWEQQLQELKEKGLTEDLLEELQEMGPDAAASIYSLNQMTAEQLDEYQKLWEQKNALAESQAVQENESLRQETNSEIAQLRIDAQTELNALNAEYRAALAELNTGLSSELANLVSQAGSIGEEAVAGLIAGIGKASDSVEVYNSTTQVVDTVSAQLSELQKAGETIGVNTLDGLLEGMMDQIKIESAAKDVVYSVKQALEDAAEIHSPSHLFRRETGPQIPAGLAEGIEDGSGEAAQASKDMVTQMVSTANEEIERQQASVQALAGSMDMSGITALNRMLGTPLAPQVSVNTDMSGVEAIMDQITDKIGELGERLEQMRIVMDSGALVGEILPGISTGLAAEAQRKGGGRIR